MDIAQARRCYPCRTWSNGRKLGYVLLKSIPGNVQRKNCSEEDVLPLLHVLPLPRVSVYVLVSGQRKELYELIGCGDAVEEFARQLVVARCEGFCADAGLDLLHLLGQYLTEKLNRHFAFIGEHALGMANPLPNLRP